VRPQRHAPRFRPAASAGRAAARGSLRITRCGRGSGLLIGTASVGHGERAPRFSPLVARLSNSSLYGGGASCAAAVSPPPRPGCGILPPPGRPRAIAALIGWGRRRGSDSGPAALRGLPALPSAADAAARPGRCRARPCVRHVVRIAAVSRPIGRTPESPADQATRRAAVLVAALLRRGVTPGGAGQPMGRASPRGIGRRRCGRWSHRPARRATAPPPASRRFQMWAQAWAAAAGEPGAIAASVLLPVFAAGG
jgi:hypothetical protein